MNENELETTDNDFFPMFSDKEMARRHKNVRKEMIDRRIDLIIVHGCLGLGNSQVR